MNEGIHLDLDTWIVPGQIRKANLCQGLGNRYTPAGTEVLISHRSSQHPTAIPGGAECHNCEHPQLRHHNNHNNIHSDMLYYRYCSYYSSL